MPDPNVGKTIPLKAEDGTVIANVTVVDVHSDDAGVNLTIDVPDGTVSFGGDVLGVSYSNMIRGMQEAASLGWSVDDFMGGIADAALHGWTIEEMIEAVQQYRKANPKPRGYSFRFDVTKDEWPARWSP